MFIIQSEGICTGTVCDIKPETVWTTFLHFSRHPASVLSVLLGMCRCKSSSLFPSVRRKGHLPQFLYRPAVTYRMIMCTRLNQFSSLRVQKILPLLLGVGFSDLSISTHLFGVLFNAS